MAMRLGPQLIKLPTQLRGEDEILTVLELPFFKIKRLFWFKGLNKDSIRGNHAHKECSQLFIPMYGSCAIEYKSPMGITESVLLKADSDKALYVPPLHWVRVFDCSENASLLVATDMLYNADDFIRSEGEFNQHE